MSDPETKRLLELVLQTTRDAHRANLEEFDGLKGEVIRLGGVINTNEANCVARHKEGLAEAERVDADVKRVEGDVKTLKDAQLKSGEHAVVKLEKEVDKLEANSLHWVRYAVTAVVGLCTGALLLWLGSILKH